MDRLEFRKIKQMPGIHRATTSGSTGIAVTVEKYEAQKANTIRHTKMFDEWHNWNPKAKTLRLYPPHNKPVWRGNTLHSNHYIPGEYEQLISYPALFPEDLTQFKRIISYGGSWRGIGIDLYSSEEFGYIAIQCPHNRHVLHIVDNLEITFHKEGMRITDLSHPYLKDYEIGDYAEETTCDCPIKLPAMTHVAGRIRNMIKLPDGTSHWPITGLYGFPQIERFQVFQTSLTKLRVHINGVFPDAAYEAMRRALGYDFEIEVVQGNFKPGKFEEFICEVV